MSVNQVSPPFDPTGKAASNRISSERQTISAPGWSNFYFIIPKLAPYFQESLVVVHHPSGRRLYEGVDFLCSHKFHDASLACGKPIYGSLTFFDKTLAGVVELTYQTIGGEWVIDEQTIQEILSNKLVNPRITTWEEVVEVPREFPVIDHEWDLVDMVGASAIVEKLEGIRDAIILAGEGGLGDHLADFNNPHKVTKAQVGLGNVMDFPIATVPQAQAGTDNASYMTPLRVSQAITALALAPLSAHTGNLNNPHGTTAAQVGLGNVVNYGVATQAQAEAGTANTVYMTALRVAQAIQTQALAPLNTHIGNKSNPHEVNKAQVGLGNVQNYGIATVTDARAGTSNVLYMTPLLVKEAIGVLLGDTLTAHINDTNNPHNTTKAQVGLGNVQNYGVATQAQAQAGTDNSTYVTPLRVFEAIEVRVRQPMLEHVNNTNNPHGTTKAHVGLGNVDNYTTATMTQVEAGVSETSWVTPAGVRRAIQVFGGGDVDTHAARTDNPHSVTKLQVGLGNVQNFGVATAADFTASSTTTYATPKGVVDFFNTKLGDFNSHLTDYDNPHRVTAAQVGAYTSQQVDTLLVSKLGTDGVAADSNRLNGLTSQQLLAAMSGSITYLEVRDQTVPTYTRLGFFNEPGEDTEMTYVAQISGGEADGEVETSVVRLYLNLITPEASYMELVSGVKPKWTLGYRLTDANVFELWMNDVLNRNQVQIVVGREPVGFFEGTNEFSTVAPVGLATIKTVVRQEGGGGTGSLSLEQINVATTADEATAAALVRNEFAEDIHDFYQIATGTDKRFTRVDADTIKADGLELNSKWEMYSPNPDTHTNYKFEVEIAATGSASTMGVCIAYVERDGVRHGLYALRSDGRLVQEGAAGKNFYKLFTVGYNLLTEDAKLVQATSDGLRWGDGVLDANRGSTAYNPSATANLWGTAGVGGKMVIAVTKTGSQFYVELRQTVSGSTVTKTFSFDVASDPALAELFSGECGWGVLVNKNRAPIASETVSVKAVNRPDLFRRYARVIAGSDQTVLEYNGDAWVSNSVNLPKARTQQRLIASDINGRLYFGARDGTLRRVFIEADTAADNNVATF